MSSPAPAASRYSSTTLPGTRSSSSSRRADPERARRDEFRGHGRPTEMTERDPTLDAFDVLIGTWATEAVHTAVDGMVEGSVTFEWLEGGHFLLMHSHADHELFPDGISVIGPPETGDGLVLEYFDSRGIRRTYGVSLADRVWRMWRDAPGFDQRFSASVAPE